MKKAAPHPIVIVDWIDASSVDGPLRPNEVTPLIHLRSVGWLIIERDDSLTLAQEWAEEDCRYRAIQSIPRVNIVGIKRLKG